MNKKSILAIIVAVVVIILICFLLKGFGKKANINEPYYGKMTVGTISFDMLTTYDDMKKLGFDGTLHGLEDEETDDEFYYDVDEDDEEGKIHIHFSAYNDTYIKYGYDNWDDICKYIELPKNITFESTVDDVIEAYGEPDRSETYSSDMYMDVEYHFLEYKSEESDKSEITLQLQFDAKTKKLYRVEYYASMK